MIEDAHEHHDIRFLMVASSDDITVSEESHESPGSRPTKCCERTNEESIVRMLHKALAL